jgi:hypothetical protein
LPPPYLARDFGLLPTARINRTIGTELAPGQAYLSSQAHKHIAEDHPQDYAACMAALEAGCVQRPTYAGQAPKHGENFELVCRIRHPDRKAVLIAIGLEPDGAGRYRIRSCYLIASNAVDQRRQAQRLIVVPP